MMMNNKKRKDKESHSREEKDEIIEVISLDMGEEGEEPVDLSAATTLDLLEQAQEENYDEEVARYTTSPSIRESLAERQDLDAGKGKLIEQLQTHHAKSPALSGGDVDAAWDEANVGEETVGGTVPTPDQDVVDELGEALGINYEDDEPLHTEEKIRERDEERWELNPESAEDEE